MLTAVAMTNKSHFKIGQNMYIYSSIVIVFDHKQFKIKNYLKFFFQFNFFNLKHY